MRQTPQGMGVKLDGLTYDRFGYADDVDFMAETLEELEPVARPFKGAAARVGLIISEDKTKVMKASRRAAVAAGVVRCGGLELEVVGSFKYLGSILTSENEVGTEVLARIASGARCGFAMGSVLGGRVLSRRTKVQAYLTIIRPVVIYGSETWRLTKELERRLQVFENSVMRRICGPVRDALTGEWRRRHNAELREITRIPTIVEIITSQRMRWAGHVARMGPEREMGNILRGRPDGRRPVGRPRMRWADNLERDMESLGVEDPADWWNIAQDRSRWKQLVMAARDRRGLQPAE